MKNLLPILLLLSLFAAASRADDRLRDVQAELKSQGFYYGEVHGQNTSETSAAIRRYQIRNGLEVTGTLTPETSAALSGNAAPAAPEAAAPPPAAPAPRADLRRDQPLAESDRSFLHREEPRRSAPEPQAEVQDDPSVIPAPRSLDVPSADLAVLFADTPYASAPVEVQEATLRRAQTLLAGRGVYRAAVDGEPGPATEEAILSYQRTARLPLTGRLDLETLSQMRLLPGRSQVPPRTVTRPESTGQRILRGIWIR